MQPEPTVQLLDQDLWIGHHVISPKRAPIFLSLSLSLPELYHFGRPHPGPAIVNEHGLKKFAAPG